MFENYLVAYNGSDEETENQFEITIFEELKDAEAYYEKCRDEGSEKVYLTEVIKN